MARTEIRNKNHVVALNGNGLLVAEAIRSNDQSPWVVSAFVPAAPAKATELHEAAHLKMVCVAVVANTLEEVRQRKLVLAMLKELW